MENFKFVSPTKIIFGKNEYVNIAKYIKPYSQNILIHFEGDGSLIQKLGILEVVISSLKKENINFQLLGGVIPNPQLSLVRKGIEICRKENIDFILAIGGGSVIDSAKAISIGTTYEGDVWDFFSSKAIPKSSLKVGVILTIPGSGSEMSESSIISCEELKAKNVCDSDYNFPVFSVLDPQVCYTIPKHLIAAGVADIMSHLLERYFSNISNVELSNSLLEATMRTVVKFGSKILEEPTNYNNCSQIMWAASIAHNGMIAAGRIADWTSHRIEHEISALYNITHGLGMAIIFPAWMKYVKNTNLDLFCQFAQKVFGIYSDTSKEKTANLGIKALEKFFVSLGLKLKLSEFGIDDKNFELIASKALAGNKTLGRFQKLNKNDIVEILKLSL